MLDWIRVGWIGLTLLAGAASADSLPAPTDDVLLTVRGNLVLQNAEGEANLDAALLESMGSHQVQTSTIWTEGVIQFEGVELGHLMTRLGADGSILRLTALNDYAVEIPMSEAVAGGPLLALRMNGVALSPRDKGPVWLVYPYDTNAEYKNEVSYSRSIWQLTTIEVLP